MIENFVIDTIKPKMLAILLLEASKNIFPKRSGKPCDYRKKCWRDKFATWEEWGVYFLLSQEHFPAPGEAKGIISWLYEHRPV